MPVKLTAQDVCVATGGTVLCGRADTVFTAITIDSRSVTPGALFVPLPGTRVDGHAYLSEAVARGASGFFFIQGKVPALPDSAVGIAVRDPLIALQDLAAWYRNRLNALVIGIAGSNGKTTTKELLAQLYAGAKKTLATQGNLNNHIGLPLTLLRADEDVEVMVLELGTSGPGELTTLCRIARPDIGVITTIAEEHTEMLKDLAGVLAAETELIAALPAHGVAIVNGDDDTLLATVQRLAHCRVVTFGEKSANRYRATGIRVSRQGTRFTLDTPTGRRTVELRLLGSHFALAAVAAAAVALECGLTLDEICTTLHTVHGAPRRMAVIEVPVRQLTILDDCYNANPASMRQALVTARQVRAAGERLIFVLGDMLELGALSQRRHVEIGEDIAALDPRPNLIVTVGEYMRLLAPRVAELGIPVHAFAVAEAAAAFVREAVRDWTGPQLVLVKGSRGVHLEEVTRRLTEI
jgi:UDP-N-acetylmuramoyl-tripeptide--D-alanyl-D-alanine ligase